MKRFGIPAIFRLAKSDFLFFSCDVVISNFLPGISLAPLLCSGQQSCELPCIPPRWNLRMEMTSFVYLCFSHSPSIWGVDFYHMWIISTCKHFRRYPHTLFICITMADLPGALRPCASTNLLDAFVTELRYLSSLCLRKAIIFVPCPPTFRSFFKRQAHGLARGVL